MPWKEIGRQSRMALCPLLSLWIFLYFCLPVQPPTHLCLQPHLLSTSFRGNTSQHNKATGPQKSSQEQTSRLRKPRLPQGHQEQRGDLAQGIVTVCPFSSPGKAVSHYHWQDCSAPGNTSYCRGPIHARHLRQFKVSTTQD